MKKCSLFLSYYFRVLFIMTCVLTVGISGGSAFIKCIVCVSQMTGKRLLLLCMRTVLKHKTLCSMLLILLWVGIVLDNNGYDGVSHDLPYVMLKEELSHTSPNSSKMSTFRSFIYFPKCVSVSSLANGFTWVFWISLVYGPKAKILPNGNPALFFLYQSRSQRSCTRQHECWLTFS